MNTRITLLVCLASLALAGWAAAPKAADTGGLIVYLDGDVTVNGQPADTGDRLAGQVTLKTGKKSVVEVVFGGQNIFRLGANTVLKIDFQAARKVVTLENGLFTSVLKKLAQVAGADPSFELRTPTVSAGVRGTSFHVSTDGKATYFCTCNGSIDLGGAGVVAFNVTSAHHTARVFTRGDDGTVAVTEGGLEDHTDASVETLAQRIGVAIDWTTPDLSNHRP